MAKSSVDNRAMDKVDAAAMRLVQLRVELQWLIMYDVQPVLFHARDVVDLITEDILGA